MTTQSATERSLRNPDDSLFIAEAQLLLAEKRTSLAAIRTGIALFALPLTILSALIATSRMYEPKAVMHFLVPVVLVCALLLMLAIYLTVRAVTRIRKYDRMIERIRSQSPRLAEMLD